MTTFIHHPPRLARTAETLLEEADTIGAALDIDPPDTGWCDHGWFDGMLADAAVGKRGMTFNAWRANALAHADTYVAGDPASCRRTARGLRALAAGADDRVVRAHEVVVGHIADARDVLATTEARLRTIVADPAGGDLSTMADDSTGPIVPSRFAETPRSLRPAWPPPARPEPSDGWSCRVPPSEGSVAS